MEEIETVNDIFCEHCSYYTGKYCRAQYCEGAVNGFDASDGKEPGTGFEISNEEYNIKKDKWVWALDILRPGNVAYSRDYEITFKNDEQYNKLISILEYYKNFFVKDETQYQGISKLLTHLEKAPHYYVTKSDLNIIWFVLFMEKTYYMGEYPKNDRWTFINELEEMNLIYCNAKKIEQEDGK